MNLSLIDPFILAQDYPDTLTEKLSMYFSTCYLKTLLMTIVQEVAMRRAYGSTTRVIT
jgi:hypothetical protein